MKSFATAASLAALAAPVIVQAARNVPIEAINVATGDSLGFLWSEPVEAHFPEPAYGDEAFDLMFRKGRINNKKVRLSDIEDFSQSRAEMWCARESPSPCWGTGYFEVGGGEWEAGHYLVHADFRYADTPGYNPSQGWIADRYNNETGVAEFRYIGDSSKDYAFYACGDIPATEDDEPDGDLYIKYAGQPTPAECQDIRLQMQFKAGTGTIDWTQSYECQVFGHGNC